MREGRQVVLFTELADGKGGGGRGRTEIAFDIKELWPYMIHTIWMAVTGTMEARLEVRFRGDSSVGEKMPAIVASSLASSLLCFTG
jgi:hypothetical protein